eukprot:scaffold81738_cov52-Phaeocystis_antarctica.AAC.1
MGNIFYVRSSPRPAPNLQSSPPLHAACAAVARRLSPPDPQLAPHRMPSLRLGSSQTPCPTPEFRVYSSLATSCSSVARGRATRPSSLGQVPGAGVREAARPTEKPPIEMRVTGHNLQRLLARPQPAICMWRTPTPTWGGGSRHGYGERDNRTSATLSDKCRSTCGSGYENAPTKRGGPAAAALVDATSGRSADKETRMMRYQSYA